MIRDALPPQSRSAWTAARARNAARRIGWIAFAGTLAVVATMAALILVPRAADERVQQRVAAIAKAPDSLPIVRRIDSLRAVLAALSAPSDTTRDTTTDTTRDTARDTASDSKRDTASLDAVATRRASASADSLAPESRADLQRRITQARNVPLVESFRALASHPLLRRNARVAALRDSIDRFDREREAHAALGGPGARYAMLTNTLLRLGRALTALADSLAMVAPSRGTGGIDTTSALSDSARAIIALATAHADSLRALARTMAIQRLQLDTALLGAVRIEHARSDRERQQLESARVPALALPAILAAALVIGLSFGFLLVFLNELRVPTVGDIDELRARFEAPVLLHHTPSRMDALIDRRSDTFAVIHLALSAVGDVVSQVEVCAELDVLAASVAFSTAAVAATESRATLVFNARTGAKRNAILDAVTRAARRSRRDAAHETDAADAPRELLLDGDTRLDVLLTEPSVTVDRVRLFAPYDLRLGLPESDGASWAPASNLVLVARRGRTSMAWLTSNMARARARDQHVRALVVWDAAVPRVAVGR